MIASSIHNLSYIIDNIYYVVYNAYGYMNVYHGSEGNSMNIYIHYAV